jgi:alkylhydroperoxidase family enzyme
MRIDRHRRDAAATGGRTWRRALPASLVKRREEVVAVVVRRRRCDRCVVDMIVFALCLLFF